MSLVEKSAPRWRPAALIVGLAMALVAAVAVVFTLANDSSPPADRSSEPSSTSRPSSSATSARLTTPARVVPIDLGVDLAGSYRMYLHRTGAANTVYVFAYIDPARGELTYIDETKIAYGSVAGRVGDRLVLEGSRLRMIDRDFAGEPTSIGGEEFVGTWRDHVVVAEYFPERTTFHEYRVDGTEARSIALVGRRPDVMGGVVGDSVVVERAGRILRVGLVDAMVREFAVGKLLGVGGDRIYFTSCTPQGNCTITEATLDGIVRTTPIGSYADSGSGTGDVVARVAPDGSAFVVFEPKSGSEVVIEGGTRVPLSAEGGPRSYTWAPSGRRLFYVDESADQLDIIDYRTGRVATVPLPRDDTVSLRSIAAW